MFSVLSTLKIYTMPFTAKSATLFLYCAFFFCSCNPDTTADFTITGTESVTLPGSSVDGIFITLESGSFATGIDELLDDNNTTRELIEATSITQLSFAVTEPASGSLNFVDVIEVYLQNAAGDTLTISRVDTLSSSEQSQNSMTLPLVQNKKLTEFLTQQNLLYVMRLKINDYSSSDREFTVAGQYNVAAEQE
jgi:hypothetical protein